MPRAQQDLSLLHHSVQSDGRQVIDTMTRCLFILPPLCPASVLSDDPPLVMSYKLPQYTRGVLQAATVQYSLASYSANRYLP